ncbi:MAG: hypothetical protein OXG78_07055 [Chloroflexi bacterium]|nr:hypothetical protein [Chloroflexota bacterium]
MVEFEDIKIVNIRVKAAEEPTGHATIHFKLSPRATADWQEIFSRMYRRQYALNDEMTVHANSIELRTIESLISPEKREKISNDVGDTNVIYRELLEAQATERAETEEHERRQAEDRRKREAELTRKLLGETE